MRIQRLATVLAVINFVLLLFLLAQTMRPAVAQAVARDVAPVLQGRALEIVDDQGRIRAMIAVQPPTSVGGRDYPETVLLRLTDPKSGPVVKLEASEEGSGLGLSDDSPQGGVRLMAKKHTGTFLQVKDRNGREQVIKP